MPFISPWEQTTCPYCFREFHLGDAPTRPYAYDGELYPDKPMGAFLNTAAPNLPPIKEAPSGTLSKFFRRIYLPVCKDDAPQSGHRICPYCHLFLPQAQANWNRKNDIIAIVGSRSSGKSNYFGVLLNLLERRFAAEVGFGIRPQMTFDVRRMNRISSRELYQQRYGDRLFRDNMVVEQTDRALVNADIKIPLIYQLTLSRKIKNVEKVRSIDLVIFDAAGEDLTTMTNFEQFGRYAVKASGIIVMIDPFRYPTIFNKLSKDIQNRIPSPDAMEGTPNDIVDFVLNAKSNSRALRPGQKIAVPTAVTLTKIDMLRSLGQGNSPLLQNTRHVHGFNRKQCESNSKTLISFLDANGAGELDANVRNQFEKYAFFGVSALGELPDEDVLTNIRPINVADPLLWILFQLGFLDGCT